MNKADISKGLSYHDRVNPIKILDFSYKQLEDQEIILYLLSSNNEEYTDNTDLGEHLFSLTGLFEKLEEEETKADPKFSNFIKDLREVIKEKELGDYAYIRFINE